MSGRGEANPYRGEVGLLLDGVDHVLRPTFGALVAAEEDPRPLRDLARPGGRFEWIVARQPRLERSAMDGAGWAETLTSLAAPEARLRLLFSQPRLGPATALRSLLASRGGAWTGSPLLERVLEAEARELERRPLIPTALETELRRLGWHLGERTWEETLELPLAERLLDRWFADSAPYRASLEAEGVEIGELAELRRWFQHHLGARLPQRVSHGVLEGRWSGEPDGEQGGGRKGRGWRKDAQRAHKKKPRAAPGPGDLSSAGHQRPRIGSGAAGAGAGTAAARSTTGSSIWLAWMQAGRNTYQENREVHWAVPGLQRPSAQMFWAPV